MCFVHTVFGTMSSRRKSTPLSSWEQGECAQGVESKTQSIPLYDFTPCEHLPSQNFVKKETKASQTLDQAFG